ncbi:hypothetical protein [Pseudarthrobacter sulfonivorans]|uniref:hypothetical protein n=1 Tax=Pseudarthrobacter sulfonivorans TaxID=121292 RepID=UPI0028636667|nr:hypothetical protein [Pseudarthrobacter sulfonivorans]MDR6417674.1 hypothetical protein [Pseudarthrobacter sulfonivorans]
MCTPAVVEAGRDSIPVMIIDSPEEAERIVTQVVSHHPDIEPTVEHTPRLCIAEMAVRAYGR